MNSIPYDEEAIHSSTLDSLVRVIERLPPSYPPGTRRSHSTGGYALLAYIIERASGIEYGDDLRSTVLEPLGLRDTGSERDLQVVRGMATGYQPSSIERGRMERAPYQQMATKHGGGSLYSTVGDIFRFTRALDRDNVVSAARYRERFPPRDGVAEFEGRAPGYMAHVRKRLDPDLTVIVLANDYAAMVGTIAEGLAAIAQERAPEPSGRSTARFRLRLGSFR